MRIWDSYSKSAVVGCWVMAKTDNKEENSEAAEEAEEAKLAAEEGNVERQEIEKLKFNVAKLSEELNTAVAELKKSIIDIRSAISEIENPFNLLRVITSEKDLEKIKGEKLPPGVKSLYIGKLEGKPEEKAEERAEKKEEKAPAFLPAPTPAPTEVPKVEEKKPETILKGELEEYRPKAERLQRGTAYLNWVWSLLDAGFTPEDIRQLSQSYEDLGFLPEGYSGQIYSLAVAAEKAKAKGLTKSKLLLNMYRASVISGIGLSSEDVKRLIAIAERRNKEKLSRRAE